MASQEESTEQEKSEATVDDFGDELPEFGGSDGMGPEHDIDVPVEVHIEELLYRAASVVAVVAVVTLVSFPMAEHVVDFLWHSYLPDHEPRIYSPLALKLTELKLASLAGVVLGIPTIVYQFYLFSRPGLYARERRYYLAAVPTSLVFAVAGIAFAHIIILPTVFDYFLNYSEGVTEVAFGLSRTFGLILSIFGFFALIFQIPIVISLGLMLGVVSRSWLATRRLLFWGVFATTAFLFSPDPTGVVPAIVALTMVILFEGTLFAAKWAGR